MCIRRGWGVHGRLGVTQPFFELQTPDFTWKFILTVPTKYEKKLVRGETGRHWAPDISTKMQQEQ